MEWERLKGTGDRIPKLGIGTYRMEGDPQAATEAIRLAVDLGMGLIDTAEMYGWGRVERIVGEALRPFDREEYFLVTKVWSTNLRRRALLRAAQGSLERLGVEYIDLYLVHWPNPEVPIEETIRAMEELVAEGKVRNIGVSNFDLALLKRAVDATRKVEIAANQVRYSLIDRRIERDLLPFCQREGILIMAYTPLEKGRLATNPPRALAEVARAVGRTPAQVALNWLISKPKVAAIPKAARVEHVRENSGALGWRLGQEHLLALNGIAQP
ncbi:MAG: aldo/keto reductase [Thermoproteota archaeon]|nr:MAG: aldo/keto reductase [Candidatus Korarchaeota archaeon]